MSDFQYSYLLGELGGRLPGGPALFYEEYYCDTLDLIEFSGALYRLMARHEMLRTTFDVSGTMRIHGDLPVPLSYQSLRGMPAKLCQKLLAESRDECCRTGPSLANAAPFNVRVFALDPGAIVQMAGRLLAIDDRSCEIFSTDLRALLAGDELPPVRYTFREYRNDAERRKDSPEYQAARSYWLNRVARLPAAPELPKAPLMSNPDIGLERRVFALTAPRWTTLTEFATAAGLTPDAVLTAAFSEVLRHWTADPHFTIGVARGERAPVHADIALIIGSFTNLVLLECAPGAQGTTFRDRARALRDQLGADLEHSAFGGSAVLRELSQRLGRPRDSAMPVIYTSLSMDGQPTTFGSRPGWERLTSALRAPNVALIHRAHLSEGRLVVEWDCADNAYPPGVLAGMFAAYESLLNRLATTEATWFAGSFDLTPAAQQRVRARINDTGGPAPEATLHELFLHQAARHGDLPAVVTSTESVTYTQLRDRANAVAHSLICLGIGKGDFVGVTANRGADQIAAMLGVMMAGACHVPVSPQWPEQRREDVIRLCGMRFLLTETSLAETIAEHGGMAPVEVVVDREALAYTVFKAYDDPLGVMVTHAAAVNTIADINGRFAIGPRDRVLAVSAYTYDRSIWDVFGMLSAGATIVLPRPGPIHDTGHLHEMTLRHGVTVWNGLPACLEAFADYIRSGQAVPLPALRLAMVSGDRASLALARKLREAAPGAECVSLNGATEASIWSSLHPVPEEPPEGWTGLPYGRPLRNQRIRVLDIDLNDRPDWVPGQIFLAGLGLARGYLGEPDLTARAFPTDPRGERVFGTGEVGRYLPDGTLELVAPATVAPSVTPSPAASCSGNLVRLGGTDVDDPLVLVHPAGGDLRCYRHVVPAVEGRHRVLGLSAADRPIGYTIEEMADQYLTDVLAATKDRPVRIAGWSMGAVVAYEIGRRLLREKRDCTVVMIDPLVRRRSNTDPSDATLVGSFLLDLAESEVDMRRFELDAQEPALEALHRIWSAGHPDLTVLKSMTFDSLSARYRVFTRNTRALLHYAPTAEPDLPVRVIEACDGRDGPAGDYLSPLRATVPGFTASASLLPGNHFTLLNLRGAAKLAELL